MRHSFNILLYMYLLFIIKSKKYCSHFMRKCKERHIRCTFCFENFIHEHLYHSDHYLLPSSSPISPLPTKFMTSFKIFIVTCIYTHMCTHLYAHMHVQLLSLSSSISAAYIFMCLGWVFGIGHSMQVLSPEGKWLPPLFLADTVHLCSLFRVRTRGKYLIEVREKVKRCY